jgi:topoisomerase IA-like protein
LPACCLNLRGVGTDRNQRVGRIAGQQPQQKKQDERSDNDRQDQNGRAANKIGKYDAYLSSMSYRLPVRSSADISQFAADISLYKINGLQQTQQRRRKIIQAAFRVEYRVSLLIRLW